MNKEVVEVSKPEKLLYLLSESESQSEGMRSINTASEVYFTCLHERGKEDRDVKGFECGW